MRNFTPNVHKRTNSDDSSSKDKELRNAYDQRRTESVKASEKILAVMLVIGVFGAFLWLCAIGMGELLKGTL